MTGGEPRAPEEEPVLAKLAEVGFEVASLAELRRSGTRYRVAVPILVAALSETDDARTLMELVRALSVPWAKPEAVGPLIELFRRVENSTGSVRWAVGNALETTWDDAHFADMVNLILDRSYGRDREMVVLGFGRSKRPDAGSVLIGMLRDHDVSGHAVKALRKLKVPEARPGLELMLGDDRAWVRREAQRALQALG